jgi:hypothetical protein
VAPPEPDTESSVEPQEEQASSVRPEAKVTQRDIIEGGQGEVVVNLDPATQVNLLNRLRRRVINAQQIESRQLKPSTVDQYLLKTDVITRINSGQLSREDYIIAVLDINDELAQKAFAAARLVRDIPGRLNRFKTIPLIGRLATGPQTETEAAGLTVKDSSYMKEVRYTPTDAELADLNQLRLGLNESLFGRGFRDPLFDDINMSIFPQRLTGESRNDIYSEISRQIENEIADRIVKGTLAAGETAQNLWTTNRAEMASIIRAANHRALESLTLGRAKEVISTSPEASKQAIIDRAKELKKIPTAEDLPPLQDAKVKAEDILTKAQAKLRELENELAPLKNVRDAFNEADTKLTEWQKVNGDYNATTGISTGGFFELQQTLNVLRASLGSAPAKDKADFAKKITSAQDAFNKLRGELTTLLVAKATAEQKYTTEVKSRLTVLEGGPAAAGAAAVPGEIEVAKNAVQTAEEAVKSVTDKITEKTNDIDRKTVSPKNKERADDLEKWAMIFDHSSDVISAQLVQKAGDEYTLDKLRDNHPRRDGQIDGAERIREAIFLLADPSKYDSAQIRRLISDEAIAKAIIHVYGADISIAKNASGKLIGDILLEIRNHRDALEAAKTAKNKAGVKAAEQNIQNGQRELIQSALPIISPTDRAAAMRLLQFIMVQGAKSAQKGEPYLDIDRHFYT